MMRHLLTLLLAASHAAGLFQGTGPQPPRGGGPGTAALPPPGTASSEEDECIEEWLGNAWCDGHNNNAACGYDGGDCCVATCVDTQRARCNPYNSDCRDPSVPTAGLRHAAVPGIQYLSSSRSVPGGLDPAARALLDDAPTLSTVSSVDDSPLDAVELEFRFPFAGRMTDWVWLNSNGAAQFSPSSPCHSYFAHYTSSDTSGWCSPNTSYVNMAAPFLADLNPGGSPNATVLYAQSADLLVVSWNAVPLWDAQDSALAFSVTLYPSGRVSLGIGQAFVSQEQRDGLHTFGPGMHVVGLRPPAPNTTGYSRIHYSEAQQVSLSLSCPHSLRPAATALLTAHHIAPPSKRAGRGKLQSQGSTLLSMLSPTTW